MMFIFQTTTGFHIKKVNVLADDRNNIWEGKRTLL